jgi:hypothetical protein
VGLYSGGNKSLPATTTHIYENFISVDASNIGHHRLVLVSYELIVHEASSGFMRCYIHLAITIASLNHTRLSQQHFSVVLTVIRKKFVHWHRGAWPC